MIGAKMIIGTNSQMRRAINELDQSEKKDKLQALRKRLTGSIGLVFTNGDLSELKEFFET